MSLAQVPSEGATCANCSALLVADQRYCLACGRPCSPVRLAFLDVLQAESRPQVAPGPFAGGGAGLVPYAPPQDSSGAEGWLRRFSPLFAVLSVLLMAMIVGLLVGHWVTQSKAPGPQVLKVEGLTAAAPVAAVPSTTTPTAPAAGTTTSTASKQSPKSESEEVIKEAKAEKRQAAKVEHAKVIKPNAKKLSSTTGKKHQEEINALGSQPIETGG